MQQKKYLHELLREEQEPFQLKTYIADRQPKPKPKPKPKPGNSVQLKKRKPIVESSSTKRSLCKNACFFSFHDSPDVRKSPLSFPSPISAGRTPVRLNVPARTAALLLEAAIRVQKKQGEKKPKAQIKSVGLGLFGSILKRLKDRNRNKKREIKNSKKAVSLGEKQSEEQRNEEKPCSCNNSRLSSAGWSESNEEKSLDLETSSSCRSEDFGEIEESVNGGGGDFRGGCENLFCSSPLSPFRFSLERCEESSGRRTPEFSSPAASPNLCTRQEKEKYGNEEMENVEQEEEDEKEQCSPVSVLDPPFENDNYGIEEEGDDSDLECSYAIVQRAQQQLLYKLRRFEKLAELDPIELEKIMLEEEDDDDDDDDGAEECVESSRGGDEEELDKFGSNNAIIPFEIKRLVSDLISEEKGEANREVVWGRVCSRLDSWKEAKSETIDMMVELELRRESCEWKSFWEEVEETAMEIEVAIFGSLVDEFSGELNKILT